MRRHKVAVGLVGFAVLLAACGKGGDLPLLPGAQAAGSSREMAAADSSAGMSMKVANVRYELADGVSSDEKEGDAYNFADTTKARVEKLAKAFNVSGEVKRDGDAWTVGATDRPESSRLDGASLYVTANGGVFSMSTNFAGSGSSGCAVDPVAPDVASSDTPVASDQPLCAPVTTTIPKNAPSPEGAKKAALDALKAAGVNTDGAVVTTESYDPATQNVRIQHRVAGMTVDGYETYVGVGTDNKIISASGYLEDPNSVGRYELASLARAVERLNAQFSDVQTLEARDTTAIAPAEPTGDEPVTNEPTVIKLTSVKLGLMLQSDYDGDLWLVPSFNFGTADNRNVAAQAAADKYIEQPPVTTEPMPVDGGATEPGSTEPSGPAECKQFDGDVAGEICASPSEAKAGEPVIFRITAVDNDQGFSTGPCFDGVTAEYGDDAGGDIRCEACSTSVPAGPGKMGVERSHVYEKSGTYTAKFTVKSGADCAADPKDSTTTVSMTIKVA